MDPIVSQNPADPGAITKSGRRRLAAELLGGAVVGFAIACIAGPNAIGWWYEPPSKDAFSCAGSVRIALGEFVKLQLVCAVIGCAGLALISFFIRRALRRRAAARAT
jgi:hypothetical protein